MLTGIETHQIDQQTVEIVWTNRDGRLHKPREKLVAALNKAKTTIADLETKLAAALAASAAKPTVRPLSSAEIALAKYESSKGPKARQSFLKAA